MSTSVSFEVQHAPSPAPGTTRLPSGPSQAGREDSRQRRLQRRKRRRRIIALGALILLAGAGYAAWQLLLAPDSAAETTLVTSTVTQGDIEESISAIGTLSPSESRVVTMPVAGEIADIAVEIGDVVEQGDVLATVVSDSLEAAAVLARAELNNLQASLADREAQLALQEANLARQQGLFNANAAAEATVQTASAQVVSARAQLESVRTQIVQQQQSVLNAEADLANAIIRAPIAGTVVSLSLQGGQSVGAGTELLSLSNLSTMTVEAQVAEADIGSLYEGMPAYFTTLSGSDRRWTGTLRRVLPTPTIQNDVVLYSIVFDVENPDSELLIGMSTETFFVVASATNVPRVPVSALRPARLADASGQTADADATPDGGAVPPAGNAQAAGGQQAPGAGFAGGQLPEGFDPALIAERFPNGFPEGFDPGQIPAGFQPGQFGQGAGANGGAARVAGTSGRYAVEVLLEDGTTAFRAIEVGVQDRVNAEVISGLAAGEQVVVGTGAATPAAVLGNGGFGPPGGGGFPIGVQF